MWPWEHLAVAYVLYSLITNVVVVRESPSAHETVAVVLGSQLPDLVDKPLAWMAGITETGYAIGHSIFVAPFVWLVAYGIARRRRSPRLAGAFSLAYLSHLVTDVLNPLRMGREPELRVVLWPVTSPPASDHGGFVDHFVVYARRHVAHLINGGVTTDVAFQLVLGTAVLVLWLFDGAPVASDAWRFVRNRLR